MPDYCLDALGARGPVTVEGSFTANPWFGPLLAGLRPQQALSYSDDASSASVLKSAERRPWRNDTKIRGMPRSLNHFALFCIRPH